MFRGKRIYKQNRIILISSRLIEFWCFGLPVALGGGGGWMGVGGMGWFGVAPTHMHMHVYERIYMHTHACVVNMIISCKWLPPLGESLGIPYDVIHVRTCVHVHVHMCGGTLSPPPPTSTHPPTHIHPHPHPHPPTPPPRGGTPGISQNSIALELIKIFQFRLKI